MIQLLVATLPRSMSNGNVSPAVRDVSAVTFLFTPITSPRTGLCYTWLDRSVMVANSLECDATGLAAWDGLEICFRFIRVEMN